VHSLRGWEASRRHDELRVLCGWPLPAEHRIHELPGLRPGYVRSRNRADGMRCLRCGHLLRFGRERLLQLLRGDFSSVDRDGCVLELRCRPVFVFSRIVMYMVRRGHLPSRHRRHELHELRNWPVPVFFVRGDDVLQLRGGLLSRKYRFHFLLVVLTRSVFNHRSIELLEL